MGTRGSTRGPRRKDKLQRGRVDKRNEWRRATATGSRVVEGKHDKCSHVDIGYGRKVIEAIQKYSFIFWFYLRLDLPSIYFAHVLIILF